MKPLGRTRGVSVTLASLALIVAACGGTGSEPTTAVSDTGGATSSAPAEGGGGAGVCDGEVSVNEIDAWAHEGAEAGAYQTMVEDFNATVGQELGLTINLTLVPEGQYTDQLNAAAAAGDLPALLDFDGPNLANLAWSGNIVSLDGCIPDTVRDNLLPSIVAGGTYEGHLYSVGSFDSGLGLYAWGSALEEVGARIPTGPEDAWTAEETEQILRDLQAAGYEHPLDIKIWYGTQGEWMTYGFSPILQSAGADLIDRDTLKADGVLNSPEAVAALTLFQSWATEGLIDSEAADDTNFTSGESPLSWVGHWMFNPYTEAIEAAGDQLVLLPLPDFGEGTRTGMGSWAWAMTSVGAEIDPDAAWAFIEFAVSDGSVLAITDVNGAVPATSSALAQSANYAPGGPLNLFVKQLEGAPNIAVPRPITPGYPTVTSEFWTAMDQILLGGDVQQVLDAAAAAIDADVDANGGYVTP
ncbi:MAG: extracellular solute-binding protein [Acidimicrobiia bacterium]|nr:extracellular solute-binding protein [Acidimicrobiia bacterium]